MGLLDLNYEDPNAMTRLQIGLGLLNASGGQTSQGIAQALQGGIQTRQAMAKDKRQRDHDELMQKSLQMEFDKHQQANADQQRLRDFYTKYNKDNSQGSQTSQAMGGDMSPRVDNLDNLLRAQKTVGANSNDPYDQRMRLANALRQNNFSTQAEGEEASALKFQPKVKDWSESMVNGVPVRVPYFENGTVGTPSQYKTAKPLHYQDTKGGYAGLDPFTGQVTTTGNYTQSPDSISSERSSALNRAQAERHFTTSQNTSQYIETDSGLVALPKKLSAGQSPVATPVLGANGEQLSKKQNIPQYVVEGITNNAKSLASINAAIASLKTTGDAVGFKGYLPNSILNRAYPEGTETRANISDVGSLVLHDRSGTVITASESPRLMPFIPLATDDTATVKKKLTRFKQAFEAENNNLTFAFPQAKKLADFSLKNADSKSPVAKFLGFE